MPEMIKDGHICFCRVNRPTDRLGNINKVIENKLESFKKSCLNQVILEAVGDFNKTANFRSDFDKREKSREADP